MRRCARASSDGRSVSDDAGESGWGGRDRTFECRNQNPVPYHLATPQRKTVSECVTRTTRADDGRSSGPHDLRWTATVMPRHAGLPFRRRTSRWRRPPTPSSSRVARGFAVRGWHGRLPAPAILSLPAGRCGRNLRKRRLFSPTRCFVSIPGLQRCQQCGPSPSAARSPSIAPALKPAPGLSRSRVPPPGCRR